MIKKSSSLTLTLSPRTRCGVHSAPTRSETLTFCIYHRPRWQVRGDNNNFSFKNMARIILIFLSLFFLTTSPAFAKKRIKTQGFQIQLDTIYSLAKHRYLTDTNYISVDKYNDSTAGFGANIKYVYNIDDILPAEPLIPFFVFAEIFGQQIGTKAEDKVKDSLNITNRYGLKFGLGSDIADNVFVYTSAGIAQINYEIDWKSVNKNQSGSKAGLIYGIGVGYHVGKHFIVSLELNNQDFVAKTPVVSTGVEEYGNIIKARANVKVAQLGLGFQF